MGFYRLVALEEREYQRGMYVVFPVPQALRALVYGRHWMRNGIPFLKEILGLAGDRVCILNGRLEINGRTMWDRSLDSTVAGKSYPNIPDVLRCRRGIFLRRVSTSRRALMGAIMGRCR